MILLPIIALILILCLYLNKNGYRLDIVSLLISTYLIMGAAALVLELSGLFPSVFPFAFEPMAYLSLSFVIVFGGFTAFNNQKLSVIKIENLFLYRALEAFLLIGGFLAIIFFLPFSGIALTGDIKDNRINVAFLQELLKEFGIINSIFSLLSNLFFLSQVCAFLNLIPRGGRRRVRRAYLLLISSFSYVVYILAYVGRDGVVFWVMSYLFCFLLFRDFIARDELKRLNWFAALVSSIFLTVFLIISTARFGEDTGGTVWQIINYGGQQIRNFNDHYMIDTPLQYGKFCFSGFIDLLGIAGFDVWPKIDKQELYSYFLSQGVEPWVFTTFIGPLILDFGRIGTLLFLFLLNISTRMVLRKASLGEVFEFSNLVLFVLLYQIVYWGVFYFRQFVTNYYMLFMFLLFLVFKASKSLEGPALLLSQPAPLNARFEAHGPRLY